MIGHRQYSSPFAALGFCALEILVTGNAISLPECCWGAVSDRNLTVRFQTRLSNTTPQWKFPKQEDKREGCFLNDIIFLRYVKGRSVPSLQGIHLKWLLLRSLIEGYFVPCESRWPSARRIPGGYIFDPVIYGWSSCGSFMIVMVVPIWQANLLLGASAELCFTTQMPYCLVTVEALGRPYTIMISERASSITWYHCSSNSRILISNSWWRWLLNGPTISKKATTA